MDWIDLVPDRKLWRTLVNTVVNVWFHRMSGNCSVGKRLVESQEGLSSMELVWVHLIFSLYSRSKILSKGFIMYFENK
jgi:hypothetical protein